MKIGTIYDITFSTNRADTGGLSSADSTPVVRVTENGVNLAYLPTVSILSTGVYLVTIDTSLANGFEVGKRYSVYVTATVNAIDGAIGIDSFTVDTRSIDDVLPTANYTTPPTANDIAIQVESAILNEGDGQMVIDAMVQAIGNENITASAIASQVRTELTTELGLINTNLDAKVSEAGGGGGATPEEIYTYFTTDNREYAFKGTGGGGIIDITQKHEDIIKKYEEIMKEELKRIVSGIPKIDISSVVTAISKIPKINLTDMTLTLMTLQGQVKAFNKTIKDDYIFERNRIESEYKNEIDKKISLLKENEYNAKENEKIIANLSSKILSLTESIERLEEEKEEKEEEMRIMDETYINKIEKVKIEKEEEIVEKIIPMLS